jgi:hypothetical protein
MVFVLKKNATKKDIEAINKKLYKKKAAGGFNAAKYNGVLRLKKDALTLQKEMRDEWERNFS